MKEDEDEIIEEKHEDSFVQTTTMTQVDFHDGDSLS